MLPRVSQTIMCAFFNLVCASTLFFLSLPAAERSFACDSIFASSSLSQYTKENVWSDEFTEKIYIRLGILIRKKAKDLGETVDDQDRIEQYLFDTLVPHLVLMSRGTHEIYRPETDPIKYLRHLLSWRGIDGARHIYGDNYKRARTYNSDSDLPVVDYREPEQNEEQYYVEVVRVIPDTRDRKIALLRLIGYTNREVGEMWGVSTSLISTRWNIAKARLRDFYRD